MRELSNLLAGRGPEIHLDRAALLLATIEYPDLEITPFIQMLDSYASELGARLGPYCEGREYVLAANHYLFDVLGFAGNIDNYYDPANSFLNEALRTRTGNPITLSVVYLEVARRLAKPVAGVGLPGHFVVEYNDGFYSTYIDAFHGGKLLGAADCHALARDVAGMDVSKDPAPLATVGKRQIVYRMINNLRSIYFSRRAYGKLVRLLDILIEANPSSAEEYRYRGLLHLQLEEMRAAKADLEKFLELAPDDVEDRKETEEHLLELKRWLAGVN